MAKSNVALARVDKQPLPSEQEDFREIVCGLKANPKRVNPKYFYDHVGSVLFEEITTLPEYYPTRTEVDILRNNADHIAQLLGDNVQLVEPGAGSCSKVRHLLDTIRPRRYLPMDISPDFLQDSVNSLQSDFPWLDVHPIAADFNLDIALPAFPLNSRVVVFYPGSTIGNLEPAQAVKLLARMADWAAPDGGVLLGADLQKDVGVLHAAYNDAKGITEKFNLNVLHNINNILTSDFDPDNFSHRAFYNEEENRIEMHLVAKRRHRVNCGGDKIEFQAGESIHTENSYKYTLEGIAELAQLAGLELAHSWCDENALFSMNYLVAHSSQQ